MSGVRPSELTEALGAFSEASIQPGHQLHPLDVRPCSPMATIPNAGWRYAVFSRDLGLFAEEAPIGRPDFPNLFLREDGLAVRLADGAPQPGCVCVQLVG